MVWAAILILSFLTLVMIICLINIWHERAVNKLNKSIDDIKLMLKNSPYYLIIYSPKDDNEFTYFGLATLEDLKAADIILDWQKVAYTSLNTNPILSEGMAPRSFLSALQRVKRGTLTLDDVYAQSLACNARYLRKLKASKTI